ncbi:hypothetical protein BIY22_13035 [Vibrio panuliri]|uniref:Uncharacterized protein n=1 Tax=Vibrio panuliri TaxID=1381081 RepID=A0A1Q9HAT8_9VIBR|nr:hypothetical protein [Vibrio panuliri]OLQ86168.1 hypothetical protein BIY22_13035 [Vibrio panuliri]
MCDVLILEWTTQLTRDRLVASQISNYLTRKNIKVKEGALQDGLFLIDKYSPKLLLLVNTVGAITSVETAKYAKKRNITVLSLYGEGNFTEDRIEQFVWGHNKKDKQIIDDFRMVWSSRARKLLVKYYPYLSKTTYISGSVGADNYIMGNIDNHDFKLKYNKVSDFSLVVGVGCWNFCLLDERDHRYQTFLNHVGIDEIERLKIDAVLFNDELIKLVSNMPDVLFLIKEHPHNSGLGHSNGVEGLEQFENVIFVDRNESIINCISVSNIWLSYESTTSMEAWLIGKNTALLNPTGTTFANDWRSTVCNGQPNYSTSQEWIDAINYFKEHGELPKFKDYQEKRDLILSNTFGFIDGLNHVRVSNFIIDYLNGNIGLEKKCVSKGKYKKWHALVKHLIWNFSRSFLGGWVSNSRLLRKIRVREWDEEFLSKYNKITTINQSNHYASNYYEDYELSKLKPEK